MLMPANTHEFVPALVERALDSLAGGILLAGIAWIWLKFARRQNSASRFLFLFILLVGIAVLPFLGLTWLRAGEASSAGAHSFITLPANAAEYLFVAWSIVAVVLLARIGASSIQVHQLKNSCVPINVKLLDSRTQNALQDSPRSVQLCVSDRVKVPTALGFGSPAKIAIPDWLIQQLSADELHHIVLHELAHVRRLDDWTNLAQRIVGALFFFHPAVWWLQGRLALEREMACDECVLAETGNARAYARSLANIAERSFLHRTVALAQAAVSRVQHTALRVSRILSLSSDRKTSRVGTLASVATLGGLTLAAAFYSPDFIGFHEPAVPANTIAATTTAPAVEQLRPVLASLKATDPTPAKRMVRPKPQVTAPRAENVRVARAPQTPSLYVPVKADKQREEVVARPAMLVVWQETYTDDGTIILQQQFWHVIVLNNVTPKEPPAKIT